MALPETELPADSKDSGTSPSLARDQDQGSSSTAAKALASAGDAVQAADVGALDDALLGAQKRLGRRKKSLVERLIYGPTPPTEELRAGVEVRGATARKSRPAIEAALGCIDRGEAFTATGKLSSELRAVLAKEKAYGFTVPKEYGGLGGTYRELAALEEDLSANGLGALAVEISGELTIGAGSLEGYGTDHQRKLFLPMIAEGRLMGFGLTEVGVGVNAKKIQAYVEEDPKSGDYRLHATGPRQKLWITNSTHGGLCGIVARVGREGKRVGLFVVELPNENRKRDGDDDWGFHLESSGVAAFEANFNSKLEFDNFPIPKANRIEADGVEVLFYCLRMGRCMLASMSAGYQRMLAADAAHFARERIGVGGPVIKHELPRLALGRIVGGALQSRALAHLSLEQDESGTDLAGLRDLTKSAAAGRALESLVATERVLGGRSFDETARSSDARSNIHVFGVVEGEDDLIRMGMVKDITGPFVDQYLAGLLGAIDAMNVDSSGQPVPREARHLRLTPKTFFTAPAAAGRAVAKIVSSGSFWKLNGWVAKNAVSSLLGFVGRLVPTAMISRYSELPADLRKHVRWAERELRKQRWAYLFVNSFYQLELTRTQIPLQRFGERVEHLVSILAVAYHAAAQDESVQRVAALQVELLRQKARAVRLVLGIPEMERLRKRVASVGRDIENNECALIQDVKPQPYAHPWSEES